MGVAREVVINVDWDIYNDTILYHNDMFHNDKINLIHDISTIAYGIMTYITYICAHDTNTCHISIPALVTC